MLLSKLILRLEMCLKSIKITLKFCKSSMLTLEKKMVSFANCKCDTLVLLLPTSKPSMHLLQVPFPKSLKS